MNTKDEILKIRDDIFNKISESFNFLDEKEKFYLAAYMTAGTCCFNRYRCYIEMDEDSRELIGRKRELKYIAVLCEKKIFQLGKSCNFEVCIDLSRYILDNHAKNIKELYYDTFAQEFKEKYIFKIAEFLSLTNSGGMEGNYEAAWSLLSVLNNIEKNNEIWEFWHIHGIIKEKINYFNRASVFDDKKITFLSESLEFWELINNAMAIYRTETDLIIWIANND